MNEKAFLDEENYKAACAQGAHLDGMLEQISRECDLEGEKDGELHRQEAFLRALLESEERKAEAREAMEHEKEKLRSIIEKLEQMEP